MSVPESVIDKAAALLGLTAVENAYYDEEGHLVITAGGAQFTAPVATPGRATGAPVRTEEPAAAGKTFKINVVGQLGRDPLTDLPLDDEGRVGLDDFTAIDGVGPVTAAKLHNAGLYTYKDLDKIDDQLDDIVGHSTGVKMRDWLHARKRQS